MIPVQRDERHAGRTKYSVLRLLKLAADGLFAFSIVPLRAAMVMGLFAVGVSSLYTLYSLFVKFFLSQSPRGFTALTILITFLGGFNLLFIGIVGEYVGRIYAEVKGRPHYIISGITRGTRLKAFSQDSAGSDSSSVEGISNSEH